MTDFPWQRRIQRAQELTAQHAFAAEILGFYIHVARFQGDFYRSLMPALQKHAPAPPSHRALSEIELAELSPKFASFLSVTEKHGPERLAQLSRELRDRDENHRRELLESAWMTPSPSCAQDFLALAFLQPYAEMLRSRATLRLNRHAYAICPFCSRKPGFGVMRQMGDGGVRSMACSFCLAAWEFRRLVCPGCGEEDERKLAVFTADDFSYIRVESCETCKTYVKTINLTKDGRAEPIVDEIASAPLDLWARQHGYAKLHANLLGM